MVEKLKILEIENFLDKKEILDILEFIKNKSIWENGNSEFWKNRSMTDRNVYNFQNVEIGKILYSIRQRIAEVIKQNYQLENIYPDLLQIIRWFDGMEQLPHADDMKNSGPENGWFHHRDFGAIIYLNDDYEGGNTYYPQHGLEIVPKPGKLAIHPGSIDYLHGVTKISNGTRYTIASFWTKDKEYFDGWIIH